jgi:hypothetical protein
MTEIGSTRRQRRPSTRSVTLRLIATSLVASAAIAGGLAIQMANGHDPALGAGASSSTQAGSGDFSPSATPPASVTTRSS